MPTNKAVEAKTMNGADLLKAVADTDAIYIGIRIETGKVRYLKWRDKSEAMRKRIKRMVTDALKDNGGAVFTASINDVGGEKTLILGDHMAA